jgi:ABC-2 type transport system permease protein
MTVLRKYVAFARIAAFQAARGRGELYGRMVFVAVILGVFSALWKAVGEAGMPIAVETSPLVWYLAVTEWILLTPAPAYVDIEADVRRGDIVYQLARPASYLGAAMAQGVGALVVRAPILAGTCFVCAFAVTGRVPDLRSFTYAVPFGISAMVLLHALYVLTGLAAFWLGDVSPLFWVWQKLLFVLGGLMLPLALYPEWMQWIAHATPFPSLLAGPGSFVLGVGSADAWTLGSRLALWAGVITCAALVVFRRAVRNLQLNGG